MTANSAKLKAGGNLGLFHLENEMNQQKIEKYVDSELLDIVDIFETIQGEGPFSGTPCVFVRLAGCNLQCPMCDTDYTSNRALTCAEAIITQIKSLRQSGLVVITGGEPFRQNIKHLLQLLIAHKFYVQIETNGTLPPPDVHYSFDFAQRRGIYIVCSPKTTQLNKETMNWVSAFKYVISADSVDPEDGLPIQALGHRVKTCVQRPWPDCPVYIQPADSGDSEINKQNIEATIDSCLQFGYTMQVQMHKLIGVK